LGRLFANGHLNAWATLVTVQRDFKSALHHKLEHRARPISVGMTKRGSQSLT
jgi:hypothetical protein